MGEFSVAVLSLLGCVFAASVGPKLRGRQAYRSFSDGLRETALVPTGLLPVTVIALVGAEAVAAAGLTAAALAVTFAGPGSILFAELALAAAAGLTAALVAGVAVVIRRGTRARCHCFGAGSERPLGRAHLIRNLSLLTVAAAGLAGTPLAHAGLAPAAAAVAAIAGALAAQLFVRWDDLAELFAPIPSSRVPVTRPSRPQRGHS